MSSDQGKDDDIEIQYDSEVKRKKSRKIKSPPKVEQQQQHEEDAYSDDQSNNDPPPPIQQQRKILRQQKQQQQQQRYQQMQFFQPQTMYSCPMPMSPYNQVQQQGAYSPAIYYPQQHHHQQQQQCCRFCNNGRPPPCPPPIQIPVPVPMPLPPTKNIIRIIKESDGGRRRRCYDDSERSLLNHQSCCSPPHQQRFYHIGNNNAGTSRAEYCSFPHTDRDYCSVVDSTEFCPVPLPTKSNKVKECCIIPKNEDSLLQCCPPSPPNNSSKYPKCFISQAPNCCFNPISMGQDQQKEEKKMITDQGSQCTPPTNRCEESTQYNPPPKYRECECQCECDENEIKPILCCPLPPTKSKYRNKNQQQQQRPKQVVITTNTCECQTDQNPILMCCDPCDPCCDPCSKVGKEDTCKQMLDDFCNRCCSTNTDEECEEEDDEECPPGTEPVQTQTDCEWPPPKMKKCPKNNCTVGNKDSKYPIQPILKKMLECHDTVKVETMNIEVCNTKAPPAAYYGEPYGFRAINTQTGELVRKQERTEPDKNPAPKKHWSNDPKCLAQPEKPISSHSSEPLEESPSQSPPPEIVEPPKVPSRTSTIHVKTTSSITTLSGTPSKGIEVQTQTATEVHVGSDVEFHKKVPSKPIQIQTDSGTIKSTSSGNYVLSPPARTSSLVPEPRKPSSIVVKTDSNTVVKSGSSVVKTSSHTSAVSNPSSLVQTSSQTEPEPPPRATSSTPVPTHSSYTIPIAEIPPEGGTFEVRVSSSGIDGGTPIVTIVPSGEMKHTSQISQTSQPNIPVSPSQFPECEPLPQCDPTPICPPVPECAPIPAPQVVTHSGAPQQIQVQVPGCAEPITYTRTDCIQTEAVTNQTSQSFEVSSSNASDEIPPPTSPPRKESSEEIIQQKSTSTVGTQLDPEPEAKPERLSMYKIRHTDCDKRVQTTYQPNCENDRYGRGIYPTISPIRFCCDEEVPRFGQPCNNGIKKKRKERSFNPHPPPHRISTNSGTIDSNSSGNRNSERETSEFDDDECYDAAGNRKTRKLPLPQPLLDGTPGPGSAITVTSTHSTYVNAGSSSGVGGGRSSSRVVGGSSTGGSGIGGSSSSGVHNTQSHESVVSPRLRRLSQPRNPVQLNSTNKDPQCPPAYNIFPNSTHAGIITRPYSRPFKAGLATLNGVDKCFEFK